VEASSRWTITGDGEGTRGQDRPERRRTPTTLETLEDLLVAGVVEATRLSKEMQANAMGAATGGIDVESMRGGLGGMLGSGPTPE